MNYYGFIAVACAMLAGCALALQIPDVKDQPDKPIDPKQIKNATLAFYNNGTWTYMLEVPCEAYLTPSRGGSQQQRSQTQNNAHDEEDDENEDDEDANGASQMTPQQRQRQQQQQQQQRQRQQQHKQKSANRSSTSASHQSQEHHLNPDELRQAHEGTQCECKCKNHDGEELDDVVHVSMGPSSSGSHSQKSSSQRNGNQRQQQQQRSQQQLQQRQQQQRQRSSSTGGSSSQGGEEDGPELVYPAQPRAGQKCIFFEDGEWENDDDELIDAVGPDSKIPGEPEEEVLEKCTFNFKIGGAGQSSQGGQQQAQLECVDNQGERDQYKISIVNGELKVKLTPQQKQQNQQQKQQQNRSQPGRNRNQ